MAVGDIIWTYFEDQWHEGDLPVMNAADQAMWLGSLVFDGARSFEGVVPDLDRHCARVNDSARVMGLAPTKSVEQLIKLAHEGLTKFTDDAAVYIRPMYWAKNGATGVIVPDAESTLFCFCLEQVEMAPATAAQTLCRTQFVRPMFNMALVNAKAACLYPNNARMMREAQARGYNNAIVADPLGNVAETATANIFLIKDGVIRTPMPNGTFLDGITRQRIIKLLRKANYQVEECTLSFEEFEQADEVFLSGNISKVTPITKIESREFEIGPVTTIARELYWEWAKA